MRIVHIFFEILFHFQIIGSMFFNYQIVTAFRKFNLILTIISLAMGWGTQMIFIWLISCLWSILLLIISFIRDLHTFNHQKRP